MYVAVAVKLQAYMDITTIFNDKPYNFYNMVMIFQYKKFFGIIIMAIDIIRSQ